MKKLALVIVLIFSLVGPIPTRAQWRHAFPGYRYSCPHGYAYPYRCPSPYYRYYGFYPYWAPFPVFYGYPYGLAWGYFGLAAFNSLVTAILGMQYLNRAYPYPPYSPSAPSPPAPNPPPYSPYGSEWGQ
jgi:hypothetical protein